MPPSARAEALFSRAEAFYCRAPRPYRQKKHRRCGGELACSTCHVILEQSLYDALEEPDEEETDMLDLAWGLEDTSRLCCQIKVSKELEGAVAGGAASSTPSSTGAQTHESSESGCG